MILWNETSGPSGARVCVCVCLMVPCRCDVTPPVVTREVSCSLALDINSFAGTHTGGISPQQGGWAHSAYVYIKETGDFSQIRRCTHRRGLSKLYWSNPDVLGHGCAWI